MNNDRNFKIICIIAVAFLVVGVIIYSITNSIAATMFLLFVLVAFCGGGSLMTYAYWKDIQKGFEKRTNTKKCIISASVVVIGIVILIVCTPLLKSPEGPRCVQCGRELAITDDMGRYGYCDRCYEKLQDDIRDSMD